jgi:hypothetical protein
MYALKFGYSGRVTGTMASSSPDKLKVSYVPIAIGAATLVLLIGTYVYLSRSQGTGQEEQASAEAKAYVKNLELSDVRMQATENFMQQQVVEVDGKITNKGDRPLDSVDVYCLFYGVDGQMIHRERVPIVRAKGKPVGPGETRAFRLPFDTLPANWNQTMPHLVVARIEFAR